MSRIRLFFFRIGRFEFWPFWLLYLPMYFYGLYLAIRAGSLTYFTAANPGMKYGGAFDTLKFSLLENIHPDFKPRGIRIHPDIGAEKLGQMMTGAGLRFPLVAKPDIGERGKGVELVEDISGLLEYLNIKGENVILQEYIDYPLEFGVLYYKYPDGTAEEVTSVVIREFLKVHGDGKKILRELMKAEPRAYMRRKYLYEKFHSQLDRVIPHGIELLLEPIGNHNRGTCFRDGNQLINKDLLGVISKIAEELPGFDYGRFDIKVHSLEDLYRGKNLRILELNGVNSEPAHIYDPDYPLLKAYRDIARHMKIIFRIGRMNHREGVPYASFWSFIMDLKRHLYSLKMKKPLS